MKLSTAKAITKAAVIDQIDRGKAGLNDRSIPFLVGDPGIGKTAIVYEISNELADVYKDWNGFYLLDGATRDPLDLGGFPGAVEGEAGKVMERVPPHWTKFEGHGLYFTDEFAQAPVSTQNVFGTVYAEHKVSDHSLPLGWGVVGATNKPKNRAGTQRIPTHIMSRIMYLEVEADADEWLETAQRRNFHPFVTSFISAKPTSLNEFDPDAEKCPTSRGWQKVSNTLNRFGLGPIEEREAVLGEIGPKGHDFFAFTKLFSQIPDWNSIYADPDRAPLPPQGDVMWLLCGILAANANRGNIADLLTYLRRFERAEFAVATFKDVANRLGDEIKTVKAVRDFRVEYLADKIA